MFPPRLESVPCAARWLCAVTVLAGVGCTPTMPATRVVGRHVELHSDLPVARAQVLATEADQFLSAVALYLQARPPAAKAYVFKNGWNLWLYLRKACPSVSVRTGACFEGEDGGVIVAIKAGEDGRPEPSSFRHELAHAVVAANFAQPMPWLDEGLAQVFESGCPPVEDPARLRKLVGVLPQVERRLVRLLGTSQHTQMNEDAYLVAWGFTWFLLQDEAYGRKAILACLEPPVLGEDAAERCERRLGSSREELAQRLLVFLRSKRSE